MSTGDCGSGMEGRAGAGVPWEAAAAGGEGVRRWGLAATEVVRRKGTGVLLTRRTRGSTAGCLRGEGRAACGRRAVCWWRKKRTQSWVGLPVRGEA